MLGIITKAPAIMIGTKIEPEYWPIGAASLEWLPVNGFLVFALDVCLLKYNLTIFKTVQTSK